MKIADDNSNMWKGILSSGLAGAGVGAAGMGLSDALSPENKKRGLLKSMLLGGALGGVTGAGARVGYNYYNPEARNDTSTGIDRILNPAAHEAAKPQPNAARDALSVLSTHDVLAPAGAGAAATVGHSYLRGGEKGSGPRVDRWFGGVRPDSRVDSLTQQLSEHQDTIEKLKAQKRDLTNPNNIGPQDPRQVNEVNEQLRQHGKMMTDARAGIDEWNARIQNTTAANRGPIGPLRSYVKRVNPGITGAGTAALTWLLGQMAKGPLQQQTWYDKVNTPEGMQQLGLRGQQQ